MNLFKLAQQRKTVRIFNDRIPPVEDIYYAINVAKEAPSGKNEQPWLFLLINDKNKKEKIKEICEIGEKNFYDKLKGDFKLWLSEKGISWHKPFLSKAPYLLIAFSDKKAPYSKESLWLAIGYLLLALEEKGLSTVTYTPSSIEKLVNFLNPPNNYKLEVILPIGYSDDPKEKYERKSLNEILFLNEF